MEKVHVIQFKGLYQCFDAVGWVARKKFALGGKGALTLLTKILLTFLPGCMQ